MKLQIVIPDEEEEQIPKPKKQDSKSTDDQSGKSVPDIKLPDLKLPIFTPRTIGNDASLRAKIDKIWVEYKKGSDETLKKDEALTLLKKTIIEVTGEAPSMEELERNFNEMDQSKSGDIDKEECFRFMKGFNIGH